MDKEVSRLTAGAWSILEVKRLGPRAVRYQRHHNCYYAVQSTRIRPGFLPVRTVPVLGLVLHVLLGLEPRTALPGTRAGGTSTVPVLAVLYFKWRISLILINLRFIFFESHLLLINIDG